MSVERDAAADHLEQARRSLDQRLAVDRYDPPERWALTSTWKRAQLAPIRRRSVTPTEWIVQLGYVDHDGLGDRHRVLFVLDDRELFAECDCAGHRHRGWCAHVARMYWDWTRNKPGHAVDVYDLAHNSVYQTPPYGVTLAGADAL